MSVSTSSPSAPPPVPAAAVLSTPDAVPSRRIRLVWRPIVACGGALVVGGLLVHLMPAPVAPQIVTPSTQPAGTAIMLPASQLVEARSALSQSSGRTLSGHWQLTTDTTGKATVAGEVARWVIEPGTHVNAGDSVVEISSGAASRPASAAESRQNRAEQEQVSAANGQTALSQNLSLAQGQLAASQERVERAQARVASARSLVKRLLAGEKIPVSAGVNKPVSQRITHRDPELTRLGRERSRAQDASNEARADATNAQTEVDGAKKALVKAQKQADSTASALSKAETDFKADKTTTDVLQSARADADDAQTALKSAQTRVDVAESAHSTALQKAATAATTASAARNTAKKMASIPPEAPNVKVEDDSEQYMMADQAATLVADALTESKAATRQADRIHARVEDYQRQVNQTSQRVESASQGLQQAQQSVLNSVPRPRFTATLAPVSGTVTWISRLAREVGVGQTVFGISQGKSGFIRFEDKSAAWKLLRVGQTLDAASSPGASAAPVAPQNSAAPSTSTSSPSMPASGARLKKEVQNISVAPATPAPATFFPTFSVRITRISPPASEGEPAQIDAVRTDNGSSSSAISNVEAQLPAGALPPVPSTLSPATGSQPVVLPLSVILPRDGSSYVAVVSPSGSESKPTTLQWRPIEIERQTAFDVEIKSGLRAGERVVAEPILVLSELKPEQKQGIAVVVDASD